MGARVRGSFCAFMWQQSGEVKNVPVEFQAGDVNGDGPSSTDEGQSPTEVVCV